MAWVMNVIFTTGVSYLGWYLGSLSGDGLAMFLALNGLILGWWAARRFMAWLEQ